MVCEILIVGLVLVLCNPTYVLASGAGSPPQAPSLEWIQMPLPDQQLLLVKPGPKYV